MKDDCLVLIAHGSKNPQWVAPFQKLADDLRQDAGEDRVFLCFMENAEPSLHDVTRQIVAAGARRFRLLPLFMAKGNHFLHDLPAEIERLRREFAGLEIELLPPIGQHEAFVKLMHRLIKDHYLQ
ncbi:MAG: cobalamin biosynthesis protein CbiX [Verrucomicrobia bacterium]|nr:cobalamin biosynthesis protein CbiX [Verrucomicrobiota bacterium]